MNGHVWVKKSLFLYFDGLAFCAQPSGNGFLLGQRPFDLNSLGESCWGKVRKMPWDNFLSPLRSFRSTSSSYEKKKKRQRKKEVIFNEIKSVCFCYWFCWREKAWFNIQADFSTDSKKTTQLNFWRKTETKSKVR